ncbi:ATP-binding cassette domain-containing protein [Echinicola jeungdonensis]|uniref:Peptidase domain-containing ABC transporter n=1 Tax=Echinicola jeungdonensis TaxID=709343 RepID=A0ABV5JA25_9BACT|nr:ATP-binding cassette domain-containing protein [Echinicola jeungdonensis]MDN3669763.1 ATP-binding cassette domain-containing protein [Echinicola jeungdonensis]
MAKISPLSRFWGLLKIYKPEIRQIYFYGVLIGLVNLSLPLGIQAIISYLQTGELSSSWVILVGIVLMGIAVSGTFQVMQLRIVENIQQNIFARSSMEFAFRLPRINVQQLDKIHAPELVNRFFDTLTIQKGLPKILIDFSLASFQIIFGMLLLAIYSPYFIVLGLFLLLVLWLMVKFTGPQGLKTSISESKYKYQLVHWLEELGRTQRSFKVSSKTNFHLRKADDITLDYLKHRESHFKVLLLQFKSFVSFKVLIAAGLLILGGILVYQQQLNIGQFVAAEIVIILIINSVEKLLRVLDSIYDVLTAFDKIGFVTDMNLDQNGGKKTVTPEQASTIALTKVNFSYPDNKGKVLKDLTLSIPSQSRVIFRGKSGGGKSTLLQVIAGILPVSSGDILLNGVPYHNYDKESFNSNVGLVFESNQIFEGTIKENITLGREVDENYFKEILDALEISDYIGQQADGVETLMDSGGRRTPRSIGQKILIARAICHQPGLLLLENPLQNIPKEETHAIIDYLTDPKHNWTLVVIADDDYWVEKSTQVITL